MCKSKSSLRIVMAIVNICEIIKTSWSCIARLRISYCILWRLEAADDWQRRGFCPSGDLCIGMTSSILIW